jgi:hypothetical protein
MSMISDWTAASRPSGVRSTHRHRREILRIQSAPSLQTTQQVGVGANVYASCAGKHSRPTDSRVAHSAARRRMTRNKRKVASSRGELQTVVPCWARRACASRVSNEARSRFDWVVCGGGVPVRSADDRNERKARPIGAPSARPAQPAAAFQPRPGSSRALETRSVNPSFPIASLESNPNWGESTTF